MVPEDIRRLDAPTLCRLAYDLGLAPEDAYLWPGDLPYANRDFWEPHLVLPQAEEAFRSLRARGFTTSQCFFNDDRQYGEAWVGCAGNRAWSVQWPREVASEEMALLLVAVLAVASEGEPHA